MAFNWQTFKTRTLTAAVFVVVMLVGLLWNQWSFFILFSVIHFGCWWEYFRLMEKIHGTTYHRYIQLGFMLVGFAIMLKLCGSIYKINSFILKDNFSFPVSVAGAVLLLLGISQTKQINLKTFGTAALGLLYISLSWGLMMNLYGRNEIHLHEKFIAIALNSFPLLIIISIWINDTMAYIVGSLIGKSPLSKISPKKTWEGTIGGIILCVAAIGFISYLYFHIRELTILSMIIAAIAAIVGTFGDLLESKLKRMANVKDSGHIMPGHGGFLDRFDSMLLAIPAVWLYLYFFLQH